jgi:hypothetical protein
MYPTFPKSLKLTASPQYPTHKQNYCKTCINNYRAVYNMLDSHICDAYKVAPPMSPPTIGWNSTMTVNEIFDQLMVMYGKPTPDAMHQNNLNFLTPYNPKDPLEILFKRCTNCQEIANIAKVPYTNKQLLMNVMDLLMHCGLYTCNMEDWDRSANANKTWLHLLSFI